MDEAKSLLLPMARFCPRCYQKAEPWSAEKPGADHLDASVCPCQSLWIDFSTLRQLDDRLAQTLQELLDFGVAPSDPRKAGSGMGAVSPVRIGETPDDKGIAKFIRGAAEFLNRTADNFSDSPDG